MQIDNQNGVDSFSGQVFRVIMSIDIGDVGTLHELVGVIGHREFASSANQFVELTEPGATQIIQIDDEMLTGGGDPRPGTSSLFGY